MRQLGVVTILALGCVGLAAPHAVAEELTLTTYYPSPSTSTTTGKFRRLAVGDDGYWTAIDGAVVDGTTYLQGPVGIGTTAPSESLELANSGNILLGNPGSLLGRSTAGGTPALLGITGANDLIIGSTTLPNLNNIIFRNGASRVVIDPAGRVGIGTTTPASRLVVQGATSDATAAAFNATNAAGGSLLFVRNDGRVGIGTTTPATALHVNGQSLWLTGGGGAGLPAAAGGGLRLFYNPAASAGMIFAWDYSGAGAARDLLINSTGGNIRLGNTASRVGMATATAPTSTLDLGGALTLRGVFPPPVSPAGQGRLYFSNTLNRFQVSENGSAYRAFTGPRMQRGFARVNNDALTPVIFPTPFPVGITPIVLLTPDETNYGTATGVAVRDRSNTGFVIHSQLDADVQWLAIDPTSISM